MWFGFWLQFSLCAARVLKFKSYGFNFRFGPLLGKIEAYHRLVFYLVVSVISIFLVVIGLSNFANAATYDASGQWADFSNIADVGLNPTVGDTHTYANIFAGVDALVTVTATQKTGTGLKVDEKDPTLHAAWEDAKDINVKLVMDGSGPENQLKFRIDFLESGTSVPITITNLSIVNKDVEGPEFVEYSGLTGYVLANVTNVTATAAGGVYRFSGSSFSSNLADQAFWIETKYSSVNSVTVTVGRYICGERFSQSVCPIISIRKLDKWCYHCSSSASAHNYI